MSKSANKPAVPAPLAMMLRSFGIKPEEIVGNVGQVGHAVQRMVEAAETTNRRLEAIEKRLDGIEQALAAAPARKEGNDGRRAHA